MRLETILVNVISATKKKFLPADDLPAPKTVTLAWYDERQGKGTVATVAELRAILTYYGLPKDTSQLPLRVENEQFAFSCGGESYPSPVIVERKPQDAVQAYVWQFAAETRMARVVFQHEELGVLFLDENAFVPFSQLDYSTETGLVIL